MKTDIDIVFITGNHPRHIYFANKIVENFDFTGWYDADKDSYESEDTLSILNNYIEDSAASN